MHDLNDVLREEGGDAVRDAFDNARTMNGHEWDYIHNDPDINERITRAARGLQLRLIAWEDIRLSTVARYLVKNVLPSEGLIVVYGPPKCGKTFWTLDIVMHVALGWQYRGHRTQQGNVVYCLFEGQRGFEARKEAFQQHFLANYNGRISFYLMPTRIALVKDHRKLIAAVEGQIGVEDCAIVVLDTLNRSMTGSESSDLDMTAYVRAADAIREHFNCAVLIVHHCGLVGGRARGHTSLLGAADAQIGIVKNAAKNIIATVEVMKDGPEGTVIGSRLEVIEVGKDDDGDPITSCVILPSDITASPSEHETHTTIIFHRAFDEALGTSGREHIVLSSPGIDSPTVIAVPVEAVRAEFYRGYVVGQKDPKKAQDARRQAFNRVLKATSDKYGREALPTGEVLWRL
jgi:hypothetical protein